MSEIIPTVGVVVFRQNEVLLVKKRNHPKGALQLPGGQIEPGETEVEAALRELYETTGLTGAPTKLTVLPQIWRATIQKQYGTRDFSFRCALCLGYEGETKETQSAEPLWADLSSLDTLDLVPNTQAAIEAAARCMGGVALWKGVIIEAE